MKQDEAEEILKMGHSVLLAGPAGCGKTFLLNKYIKYLKDNNIEIGVTASTGLAASHLNGRTIHSWCGMGIVKTITDINMKKLLKNNRLGYRIRSAKVLIIDEISMLNARQLDLVSHICQAFKQDIRPFGNMQVILCGDFFQLPPIVKESKDDGRFVIDSDVWQAMDLKICYITEQHRQWDAKFLDILNNIREARSNSTTYSVLQQRLDKPLKINIRPTKLYTHKVNVTAENDIELKKLPTKPEVYVMHTQGPEVLVKSLKESYCLAPEILTLKKGAIVMFVKNNFERGYINGTLGKVIDFDDDSGFPMVETVHGKNIIAYRENWAIEDGDEVIALVSQVPLRLAWAITVHKSQGMTLDCAEIDLSKSFEFGMGYVALSRVRSFDTMKLIGLNKFALQVNKNIVKFDKKLKVKSVQDLNEITKSGRRKIIKKQRDFLRQNKNDNSYDDIFGIPLNP